MIAGRKKGELSKENIFSKITDYDVYKMFCPMKFTPGKRFKSPMPGRKDDTPSFLIKARAGKYYHIDFGRGEYHGDCIEFVRQIEGVDYITALKRIDNQFGLGLSGELKDWKSVVSAYIQPEIEDYPVDIKATYKKFTPQGHQYWNAYHLSEDYLKGKRTYQGKQLYIDHKRYPVDTSEPWFVYEHEDGLKVYRPTISRKAKGVDWRFRSSLPFTTILGKENIVNCNKSLVLKSMKDQLVTSLIYSCVCSVQGESIACFSEENVSYLNENSQEVYINFGADSQGVEESKLITNTFGWKHFNTPARYLPDNDNAELAKAHGLKELEKLLKQKHIL